MLIGILFLAAQLGIQETRVPFDSAGRVLELGPDAIRRLSWFAEMAEAQRALLFMMSDSSRVVEVYGRDGMSRQRCPIHPDELKQMQQELAGMVGIGLGRPTPASSGRWLYLINSFLYSYGIRGPLVATALETDKWENIAATYLLTGSAAFFVPLVVTRNTEITYGNAFLSWYGATRGAYAGYMITRATHMDFYSDGAWPPLLGSIGLDVGGFALASKMKYTPGQAAMVTTMGDWGILGTLGTIFLININVDEDQPFDHVVYELVPLGGMAAGLVSGHHLGRNDKIADGDPRVFRLWGQLGAMAGFTAANYFFSMDEISQTEGTIILGGAMAGCAAGSLLGHRHIMKTDYTYVNGLLVEVGADAGLAVAGAVLLLLSTESMEADVPMTLLTGGAIIGAAATAAVIRSSSIKKMGSLEFSPMNLVLAWAAREKGVC